MKAILTENQRWLLAGVGGWMVADCLTDPDAGIPRLMRAVLEACGFRPTPTTPAPEPPLLEPVQLALFEAVA